MFIKYGVCNEKLYFQDYDVFGGHIDETGKCTSGRFSDGFIIEECRPWRSINGVYIVYFNSETDDWYDLIAEVHRRSGNTLRINKNGDVFLVAHYDDDINYGGLHIKRGEFIVTCVNVFAGEEMLIHSVVKKDAFSMIDVTRNSCDEGEVPHPKDYKVCDITVDAKNLKRLIKCYERRKIDGLFDLAISCIS